MKSYVCVCLVVFCTIFQSVFCQDDICKIVLSRVFEDTNYYVWTCDCPDPDGAGLDVVSRVQVNDPPGGKNTAAQVGATISCALRQNTTLTRDCQKDPSRFENRATRVLERCIRQKPSKKDRKKKGPFTFDRSTCQAFLGKLLSPTSSAAVWLCICAFPRFRVIPFRAPFVTTGSPIGAREEVLFLETCTESSKEQLSRVCQRRPEDFTELGVRKLRRCCKRARRMAGVRDQCDGET